MTLRVSKQGETNEDTELTFSCLLVQGPTRSIVLLMLRDRFPPSINLSGNTLFGQQPDGFLWQVYSWSNWQRKLAITLPLHVLPPVHLSVIKLDSKKDISSCSSLILNPRYPYYWKYKPNKLFRSPLITESLLFTF